MSIILSCIEITHIQRCATNTFLKFCVFFNTFITNIYISENENQSNKTSLYLTHLHGTSHMSPFLHVEFFAEYSLCHKLVKTRSPYYFCIQSYGILKTAKTANLKAHNNEKMAVKDKEPYFNIS